MGMYDTINGAQVKCFPWTSIYNGAITYHGGDLAYYDFGSEVPYRKPHYNYGKNFIILDLNRYVNSNYCPYDYYVHVIVDGKVKDTFENTISDIDWSINDSVVNYYGNFINIKNTEDMLNYIKDQRTFWEKYEEVNKHHDELFSESLSYFHGIGLLDKNSEERIARTKKLDEFLALMEEEKERIKPEVENLSKTYLEKWQVDTSDINDLIVLGEYIDAAKIASDQEDAEKKIKELLSSSADLYDRYVQWQGSDDYIKEYEV